METPPPSSTPPHIPGYSSFHDEPEAPASVCLYPSYKSVSDVRLFMLNSVLSTTALNPLVATTHRQSLSEIISPLLYMGLQKNILLASSQILPGTNDDDTLSEPSILGRPSPLHKRGYPAVAPVRSQYRLWHPRLYKRQIGSSEPCDNWNATTR